MTTRGQGVTPRLIAFFRDNPHEELTIADVMAKFGCIEATARKALCIASKSGTLERVSVYRLKETK